ncbi:MAG: hypothetical protein M3Q82_00070 [Actinomycetota bacterium]|nr:hypothetical protein [Actinomycetota bacterium]
MTSIDGSQPPLVGCPRTNVVTEVPQHDESGQAPDEFHDHNRVPTACNELGRRRYIRIVGIEGVRVCSDGQEQGRDHDQAGWHLLRAPGSRRHLTRGGIIRPTGGSAGTAVLVEASLLKVVGVPENGTSVVLAIRNGGELVAHADTTDVPHAATHLVAARPETAMMLLASTAGQAQEADLHRIEFVSYYSASGRVLRVLASLVARFGNPDDRTAPVVVPLDSETWPASPGRRVMRPRR